MRLGYVQFAPEFGEVKKNLQRVEELMGENTADLWVLPELCTSGYQFRDRDEVEELAEPIPSGPSTSSLLRVAKARNAAIAAGIPEKSGDQFYNSAILVGPTGLLALYRKAHLFFREKLWFAPGNFPLTVAQVKGVPVGLMICYDHMFPEVARVLALGGALILAHPANLVMPGLGQLTMRVRALENRVFAATANRVGKESREEPALTFTGGSQIVSPKGEILAKSGLEEGAVVVEIDPGEARDKHLTPENDLFRDRRPDLYRALLE